MPELPTAPAAEAGFDPTAVAALRPLLGGMVEARSIPCASWALARDGAVFERSQVGFADIEAAAAVRPDTIFRVASMTKAVTGAASMIAVDDGAFGLDDQVADYLPEFADAKVWTPEGSTPARPITLRHLLTHTSGLTSGFLPGPVPDLYLERNLQDGMLEGTLLPLKDYVAKLAALPLICQPGSEWNYGEGLAVMGRVIEVVSGQRYGDFLQTRLFGPLGMADTGFWVPPEKFARLASLYGVDPNTGRVAGYRAMYFPHKAVARPFHPMDMSRRPAADLGGAGLVSTVEDTLRFAMMLAGEGTLGEVSVLRPQSVAELRRGQLWPGLGHNPVDRSVMEGRGQGMDMGLGVVVVREPGHSPYLSARGAYGFSGATGCKFWVDPDLRLAGVFFTHAMNGGMAEFHAFEEQVYAARV